MKEAVCIDTKRVYDSCADKDCISDIRVMFTDTAQEIIDHSTTVKCRGCELLNCFIDVEEVPFNRGFYTVDITFFFKVRLDAFVNSVASPRHISGLVDFSKKCILYGSDGRVKVFSSEYSMDEYDDQLPPSISNPIAKVQAVDPICLEAKLCSPCECRHCHHTCGFSNIPLCVCRQFNGAFAPYESEESAVVVTLGLFTIVQLERDVQILIPAYDFCVPNKECTCDTEDPCDSFRKIRFPLEEFFPPSAGELGEVHDLKFDKSCGCR
ncbi:MAG: hypothetical protein LBH71_01535 [Oscillospiraceae bacterium]|nr:hypothetical protein [Oscillospiraceae bacterium]